MFPIFYLFSDYALLILRVTLGLILAVHGWPKIKDLRGTGALFASIGFRPGVFWAFIAAVVEFFGGLALILGVGVQAVSFFVAGEFVVINIWKITRRERFTLSAVEGLVRGLEFDLLILASALALLAMGGGAYTLL